MIQRRRCTILFGTIFAWLILVRIFSAPSFFAKQNRKLNVRDTRLMSVHKTILYTKKIRWINQNETTTTAKMSVYAMLVVVAVAVVHHFHNWSLRFHLLNAYSMYLHDMCVRAAHNSLNQYYTVCIYSNICLFIRIARCLFILWCERMQNFLFFFFLIFCSFDISLNWQRKTFDVRALRSSIVVVATTPPYTHTHTHCRTYSYGYLLNTRDFTTEFTAVCVCVEISNFVNAISRKNVISVLCTISDRQFISIICKWNERIDVVTHQRKCTAAVFDAINCRHTLCSCLFNSMKYRIRIFDSLGWTLFFINSWVE